MNITDIGIEVHEQLVSEMEASETGRVPKVEFEKDAVISEMLGTDDGAREFIEQVTYSSYQGRENVALKYGSIYRTVEDENLPETLTAKEFGAVQAVFLRHWEGGEVKFGDMGAGTEKTVSMLTWATGMEYNEDIVVYNKTWEVTDIAVAFGEAYNHLLNHLHLGPIVTPTYTTTGGGLAAQRAAQEAGTAQLVAFDTDIETTLKNALQVLPAGSIVLHHSSDLGVVQEAIAGAMHQDNTPNTVKSKFGAAEYIEYDEVTITVGEDVYTNEGVTAGNLHFIVPQANFREYVKHGLRTDSNGGDLTRLVLAQVVGRTRRGVLAGIGGKTGAIKIALS